MTNGYFPLRQLTDKFYEENLDLQRVLDKHADASSFKNKGRGYGVVVIELQGLRFGIPLRSRMTHKECFATEIYRDEQNKRTIRKGLDYTKAVLLTNDEYIAERSFKIPSEEFDKINDSREWITKQFTKFVARYVAAVQKNDQNILKDKYRDSTLINYHEQLGLLSLINL